MSFSGTRTKIFVIDTDSDIYKDVQVRLEKDGAFELVYFSNLKDPTKLVLLGNIPDMVFVNLFVGEESGIDFVKILKSDSQTAHIPVFVTGSAFNGRQIGEAIASGCDELLQMPFDADAIYRKIKIF